MYLNIGIDVSKNKHDACILNENGEQIGKFMKLTNTKTSLDKFLEQIKKISEKHDAKIRIGLELLEYSKEILSQSPTPDDILEMG
jgi:predicted NBD/HSP70 family sugar kinase